MLKIKSYVKVNSIEEAYELNQKKTAIVLGGMVWLKMGIEIFPQPLIFPDLDLLAFRKRMRNS